MQLQSVNAQKGMGKKERLLIDSVSMEGKSILRADDVTGIMNVSKQQAGLMLSRLTKKGWLQRLKAGVYRIIPLGSDSANPVPQNTWSIAAELFSPGYIGGWTALEYWDLTEQISNETVFYTSVPQRKSHQQIAGLNYKIRFTSLESIFGTKKIWINNIPVQTSDLHRTIIDILDDPSMGGGGSAMIDSCRAYAKMKEADFSLLWQYALRLNSGAVYRRLGLIAEKFLHVQQNQLEKIKEKRKSGIILLDPSVPAKGDVNNDWGIRLNIPAEDLL